ncbi:MAG: calcium/sodium antiporter [Planctomycetes bacterium]|nr:calcium/sodium antiporter [Planctomycetota bacterium]
MQFLQSIPAPITFILGMLLLVGGGKWLVDGAVGLARRFGLSTLWIGLTLVAVGTSAPELAFNVIAGIGGSTGLCFGNIVGSNIANLTLVLGVAAMVRGLSVHSRVIQKELPLLLAASVTLLAMAYAPLHVVVGDAPVPGFARIDGIILLVALGGMLWLWFRLARQDRADPLVREAVQETVEEPIPALPIAILGIAGGLVALACGGKLAEVGAVGIASSLGVPESLIGLTIVALATSLPELVTSIIAARRGHGDLAVGNVVGSNIMNILLVLGTTATIQPVPMPMPWGGWDLLLAIVATLLLLPIAVTQETIKRREGIVLLAAYVGYITFTVVR